MSARDCACCGRPEVWACECHPDAAAVAERALEYAAAERLGPVAYGELDRARVLLLEAARELLATREREALA